MANGRWITWFGVGLLAVFVVAGWRDSVAPGAVRPTTPTTTMTAARLTPTATRSLPVSVACETYATALAGPSFGASWIPDLERACLGGSSPRASTGSDVILVPTVAPWLADPMQPTPAASALWLSEQPDFLETCGVSCSPAIAGTCGVSDYAVVAGSTGLAYYPPAAAFGVNAAYCVDGYGGPPRGLANGADPFGFCTRSGDGCVGPRGGPCDAYTVGCVPFEAADTVSRCDRYGACADDPYTPDDESASGGWFDPVTRCERGYGFPEDCNAGDDGFWFPRDTGSTSEFEDPFGRGYDNPYALPDEPYDIGADLDGCEPGFGSYDDC